MDLNQLAQLGEFIGGVGVFATLIYLTIQVRHSNALQNTAAQLARAEANDKSSRGWSVWRQMLTNSELSAIWGKAHNDAELTPDEKRRLHFVVAELTYASIAADASYTVVGATEFESIPAKVVAREIGTSRTMREAWEEMGKELGAYGLGHFEAEVSSLLEPVD